MIKRVVFLLVILGLALMGSTTAWGGAIDPVFMQIQVYAGPSVTIEGASESWWSHSHEKEFYNEWGWYEDNYTSNDGPGNYINVYTDQIYYTNDDYGFAEREATMRMGAGAGSQSNKMVVDFSTGLSTNYAYYDLPPEYRTDPGYADGWSFAHIWGQFYVNEQIEATISSVINGPTDDWSVFGYDFRFALNGTSEYYYEENQTYLLEPGLYNWFFDFEGRIYGLVEGASLINGQINLSYGNGEVPIPGAVWLLGSGLIGLMGLRRKLKA